MTETVSVYHWINTGAYTCDSCSAMDRYSVEIPTSEHPSTCDCYYEEEDIEVTVTYGNVDWSDNGYSETNRRTVAQTKNTTDRTGQFSLEHSASDSISTSISINSGVGINVGAVEASISSEVSSEVSHEISVSSGAEFSLEPGETLRLEEVTYTGTGIIYAERQLEYQRTPILDYDIEGGIDEIGSLTYTFYGIEPEIE